MAATLAGIRDRVEAYLVDSSNLSWSTATLDEGIRLALAGLSKANGSTLTLKDLDSATATTLPVTDESWLVVGAAGHAAMMRGLDRLEKANLGQNAPQQLLEWGRFTLAKFEGELEAVRLRLLQRSSSAPHGALEWTEEPPNWD